MPYSPGDIIHSKYRVERILGEGAYAQVYLVTNLGLQDQRALKVLSRETPGISPHEYLESERRFQFEARQGAALVQHSRSPRLLQVHAFESTGTELLLEMEYAPGGSLQEIIDAARKDEKPIEITVAVEYAIQAAEGLAVLHVEDLVHRDVKPSNLLLDARGQVKLADFGLLQDPNGPSSRMETSHPRPHPGSPAYMSPEQRDTLGLLTPPSDVFALGIVLFELLTLRRYHLLPPGVNLRDLRPDAPEWLEALLANMLAKDPAKRPANSSMLLNQFKQHALPGFSEKPGTASIKNNRGMVVIGVVLLMVFFLIGAWRLYPDIRIDLQASPAGGISKKAVNTTPVRMSGDFRVAVAEFDVIGNPANPNLGRELADCVYQRLVQTFAETKLDFSIVVWGPDKVRSVSGTTADERALDAQNLASALGADILVYSTIDVTQPVWQVQPEFLITSESFYQAAELNGPAQLGAAFTVTGMGEIAQRLEFSTRMTPRVNILAHITVGLAYLSAKNYPVAIRELQAIEALPEWEVYNSKEVLYLLVGNAALLAQDIPLAESYFLNSLNANPEYARAMIGLGGVYYLQALIPFNASKNSADTDMVLLQQSIDMFLKASRALDQPPLADIPAKVHYGLGQGYFMRVYSGKETSFDAAANEFKAVIDSYGEGINPRIREITAESHARLGLIYSLTGNDELVSSEYSKAAALLFDDPVRSELYQKRAEETRIIP